MLTANAALIIKQLRKPMTNIGTLNLNDYILYMNYYTEIMFLSCRSFSSQLGNDAVGMTWKQQQQKS